MQPKIKAKARCADGEVGSISKVIVDPLSLEISHVVVREGGGQGVDRQVPIGQVQEIPNEEEIILRGVAGGIQNVSRAGSRGLRHAS